jgi:AcrR family transcriptional regulator
MGGVQESARHPVSASIEHTANARPSGRVQRSGPTPQSAGERSAEDTLKGTGNHPDGHKQVSEIQRARIVASMVSVASEHGVRYATVARVVARSGVSRRTFYELFVDREDCFVAAFDQCVERIAAVVVPAYHHPSKWRERVRAGLTALLEYLDREPAIARLTIVETLGAGHRALERRRRGIAQIIALIDHEGREAGSGEGPPPLTAEGLVGGALSLIHARIVDDDTPLVGLLGPLMATIVLPYLGPAAARRELTRADTDMGSRLLPAGHNGAPTAGLDPLRELDMRLTYRTIRVLLAIGELSGCGPHPSNRQVGDAAGIRDQGQVSKLLARLRQLGLIDNAAHPRVKGEPNAWTLTQRGAEVREVLSA